MISRLQRVQKLFVVLLDLLDILYNLRDVLVVALHLLDCGVEAMPKTTESCLKSVKILWTVAGFLAAL